VRRIILADGFLSGEFDGVVVVVEDEVDLELALGLAAPHIVSVRREEFTFLPGMMDGVQRNMTFPPNP
jgi:hypothetical protein